MKSTADKGVHKIQIQSLVLSGSVYVLMWHMSINICLHKAYKTSVTHGVFGSLVNVPLTVATLLIPHSVLSWQHLPPSAFSFILRLLKLSFQICSLLPRNFASAAESRQLDRVCSFLMMMQHHQSKYHSIGLLK